MSIPAASTLPRRRLFSGVGLIRLYVGCLVACATLVWAGILLPWTPSLDREMLPRLLALAALAYATEAWVVHVHYRRQAHTLSLNEIVIVLGLFYVPPVALLIAQLMGATLALSINRRQRSVKLMFNIAQLVLTTGLAVNIFQLALGSAPLESYRGWVAAMLAVSISALVGVLLVAVVIGIANREWSVHEVLRTSAFSIVGTIAAGSVALVSVELIRDRPATMVLLLVPTSLCGLAFRSYMRQRQESERVQFLYESMRKTQAAADPASPPTSCCSPRGISCGRNTPSFCSSPPTRSSPSVSPAAGTVTSSSARRRSTTSSEAPSPPCSRRGRASCCRATGRRTSSTRCSDARGIDDAIVVALRGEQRLLGLLLIGDRAATSRPSSPRTSSCSARSPATRASCSRTTGSSSRSPR